MSVVAGVISRYETFTINSTAPIWFHEVPERTGAGAAVVPPYVVLQDDGTTPEYDFEYNPVETTRLRFEVYASTLAAADAIAAGIRYNGGSITAGAGMDFAAALTATGQTFKAMARESEQRFLEPQAGANAGPVYRIRLVYRVQMLRTA
jgi:hypothetical protein